MKFLKFSLERPSLEVALLVSAWIEMAMLMTIYYKGKVALLVSAWIEINRSEPIQAHY